MNSMFQPQAQQMPLLQQNAPFITGGIGNKPLPHIDDIEKKLLDIRSMAAEERAGIETYVLEDYNEVIRSNNTSLRFEPCKFIYYMYEEGNYGTNDEAYDEDSAIHKAQLEMDLENILQDPKTSDADRNIAKNIKVRAVKGIKNLKSHISPLIVNKLKHLNDKQIAINERLGNLEKDVADSNNKFIEMKLKQKGLYRKLLSILHKVECVRKLTCIIDGRERQMEDKLTEIERNLRGPFTDIQLLTSMKGTTVVGGRPNTDINDVRIDKDSLKKILELLEPQRQGLEHLSNVTKKDNYYADEMINKINSLKINL